MRLIAQFIYLLNRVLLFALSLGFLSFYLVSKPSWSGKVRPIVEYATQYLPILLVPVIIAMLIGLIFRYVVRNSSESYDFGDIFSGLLALVVQIGVIVLYRALGSEVVNSNLLPNIPHVTALAKKVGILGVAALQFITFILYWIAGPNQKLGNQKRIIECIKEWLAKPKKAALAAVIIDKGKALEVAVIAINAEIAKRFRDYEKKQKDGEQVKEWLRLVKSVLTTLLLKAFLQLPFWDDAIACFTDMIGGVGESIADAAHSVVELAQMMAWPELPGIIETLNDANEVAATTAGQTAETLTASFSYSYLKDLSAKIEVSLERISKLQNLG